MNQWINESMNQWINESINQWIDELMNRWIKDWINNWNEQILEFLTLKNTSSLLRVVDKSSRIQTKRYISKHVSSLLSKSFYFLFY